MKIHRAIPVAVLSIAGLVPLWLFDAQPAATTELAAEVGIVPQAQAQAQAQVQTQATPAPPAASGTAAPPTTTSGAPAQSAAKTVNGTLVRTSYGDVQVQATFTGNKITAVKFLKQPNSGPTKAAAPVLIQETLQAGTADVDSVSGATQTSQAYVQSLQAAIDAKGN